MRRATPAEIRPWVVQAARHAARVGAVDESIIDTIAQRGEAFIAFQGGRPLLGYVVEADGRELWVTSAAGNSESFDLTRALVVLAEAHGAAFDTIRFNTVRRGLVRKAARFGFVADGRDRDGSYIMRKRTK